jgi:hypothetical protein
MFAMAKGAVDETGLIEVGFRVEGFRERNRRFCAARVAAFLVCMGMPSKAVEVNLGGDVESANE